MNPDHPDLTDDQCAATAAWEAAQAKAAEGRRLIDEASAEARQAISTLHRSGMPQKQIAALLGITQGRVSQLIDRAPRKEQSP